MRKQNRNEREQLLTLVNQWDPAGLLQAGKPRNSYDLLVDNLLSFLFNEPGEPEIAAFLDREVRAQYKVKAPESTRFATKVLTWSRMSEE